MQVIENIGIGRKVTNPELAVARGNLAESILVTVQLLNRFQ